MSDQARRIAAGCGATDTGGRPVIGAEHLFLAIPAEEDGIPGRQLAEHHDLPAVSASVRAVLDAPTYRSGSGRGQ